MEYYSAIHKKVTVNTHNNLDGFWEHYAEWEEKPVTKGHILYDSIYTKFSNHKITEEDRLVVARGWGGGEV